MEPAPELEAAQESPPAKKPRLEDQKTDVVMNGGGEGKEAVNDAGAVPRTQTPEARDATKDASSSAPAPPVQKSGAYTMREDYLIKSEADGDIAFKYVENNGAPDNMMYLIGLKNIFSKQLPNMPKEYICRLVLDRRHRSVALVKRNGTVVGGITYRTFPGQGLGEIAFCAITSSEQVKGFGTRLMNYTKEYAITRDHLTFFLTYADNNAVGYFSKQGFTKAITMEKDKWHGFIKDYDGGTLMECLLHPKLRPAQFPTMIRAQRAALDNRIRAISNSHVVHKGLTHFRQPGQRTALPIGSIPGVVEAGWSAELYGDRHRFRLLFKEGPVEATPESLQRFMTRVLQELMKAEDSWPFRVPVSKDEAPDYYDVIKDPVDLSLISQRIASAAYYFTLDIFVADFRRMFQNCRNYNSADTIYCKLANKLEVQLDQFLATHVLYDA